MRILFLLVVLSVTSALQSQVVIKENAIQSKYAFPLVTSKAKAVVVYDTDDYLVVRKTAELFVSDVESVTGQQLRLTDKLKGDKEIIIVGTVEKNRLIRQLAEKGKLDISSLEGAWERFLIQTVSHTGGDHTCFFKILPVFAVELVTVAVSLLYFFLSVSFISFGTFC